MTRQSIPEPAKADFPEAPGQWPGPGHVGIAACGEDGARVWVSARRALFEGDDGLTVADFLPTLDEAQQQLREQHKPGDG